EGLKAHAQEVALLAPVDDGRVAHLHDGHPDTQRATSLRFLSCCLRKKLLAQYFPSHRIGSGNGDAKQHGRAQEFAPIALSRPQLFFHLEKERMAPPPTFLPAIARHEFLPVPVRGLLRPYPRLFVR